MAKNYVQKGDVVEILSPVDILSGAALISGSLFGVAAYDALTGAKLSLGVEGVYELPKLSTDNMTQGSKVNWNDTNKELQLATADLDGVATVVEAAGAATTSVKVKLTPV